MKSIFSLLFLYVLITSCEGNTSVKYSLLNKSSENITVYYSYNESDGLESEQVQIGATFILFELDVLGAIDSPFQPTEYFDTLIVVNTSMDTMQKDFSQTMNWQNQIDQLKKFPPNWGHEYTIEVTDESILKNFSFFNLKQIRELPKPILIDRILQEYYF